MMDWMDFFLKGLKAEAFHDFLSRIGLNGYKIGFDAGFADTNDGKYEEHGEGVDRDAIAAIGLRTHALSEKTISEAKAHLAVNATKLQEEINAAIKAGMSEKEALIQVQSRVQDLFSSAFPNWKLERLVRDQFLVATKEGRRGAWHKRGVQYRVWTAHHDSHTASDSKRMDGQIAKIDEPYIDPKTGDKYMIPHIRPNDRCYERPLYELPDEVIHKKGLMYMPDSVGKHFWAKEPSL